MKKFFPKSYTLHIILISVIILYSCKHNTSKHNNETINLIEFDEFPFSVDIQPFQESKENIFKYAYVDLKIIDDYIVIVERKSDDILRFLDKQSLDSLFPKVLKGNGPDEVILPGPIQVKGKQLFLLDKLRRQLYEYNIDELNRQTPFNPVRKYKLNKNAVVDAKQLDSNNILITGEIEDGLIQVVDRKGIAQRTIGLIPDGCPTDLRSIGFYNLSYSFRIELFPNHKQIITGSMYSDKLQIFSTDGTELINIVGPDKILPKCDFINSQIVFDRNQKRGYCDVVVKERYIYGLYSGISPEKKTKQENINCSIFVFKHDGTPVGRYNINCELDAFDVDEEERCFYGLQFYPNKVIKLKYENH